MSNNTQTKTTNTVNQEEQTLFADTNISMKSGRLTRDAKVIADGKFVKFSIAANKQYLGSDGEVKSNVNYFNALVSSNLSEAFEIAKDLKKGDWVYFKGEDATQAFDTPEGYRKTQTTTFAYQVTLKKEKNSDEQAPQVV
ncbi:single-stranded DNA-binding protein [Kordia sp. SMS9]|uniref:single-stranded DNA-binding protein n=1 Tax=Kordia sp. SMS9 TaxID=2282170 RepID=UPI000E0D8D26|nr:single-stranded DNA-binding protein [Kordia sp. SMS9]AXG69604.1 single-stranded DNA-binding protein [Kordia sp. SMS9]